MGADSLETTAMTKRSVNQLRVMKRATERVMFGISVRDKIRNEEIRRRTKIVGIMKCISELKWQWVGHVARQDQDR